MRKTLTTKKRTLAIVLCSMVAFQGFAQSADDEETLNVYTKTSNEAASYSLEELGKITFSDKGVQIWNTQWPTEYAYTNVRKMTFTCNSSLPGIPTTILRPSSTNGDREVYDLQGRQLNSPKKGVSIIRLSDGTIRKVVVK